jgi:hypothetical protein
MSHLNLPSRIHESHEATLEWDWNQVELCTGTPINPYWPDYNPRKAEVEMLLKSKQGLTIGHGGITIYDLI